MDDILILLLQHGAHLKPIKLGTAEIGEALGMSQQNASRRLIELENEGYLDRKEGLLLTAKAKEELAGAYAIMKTAFEGTQMALRGIIEKGLGEGKYYLSMQGYKKGIRDKLGFTPFPGTLNVKMDPEDKWKRQALKGMDPIIIPGFSDGKRTYGDLYAYRCRLKDHDCAIILPLRTHHGPDIIEIISKSEIKKEFRLKDGDRVEVLLS